MAEHRHGLHPLATPSPTGTRLVQLESCTDVRDAITREKQAQGVEEKKKFARSRDRILSWRDLGGHSSQSIVRFAQGDTGRSPSVRITPPPPTPPSRRRLPPTPPLGCRCLVIEQCAARPHRIQVRQLARRLRKPTVSVISAPTETRCSYRQGEPRRFAAPARDREGRHQPPRARSEERTGVGDDVLFPRPARRRLTAPCPVLPLPSDTR